VPLIRIVCSDSARFILHLKAWVPGTILDDTYRGKRYESVQYSCVYITESSRKFEKFFMRVAGNRSVIQEASDDKKEMDGLQRIKALPHVMAAEMFYHYVDDGSVLPASPENEEVLSWA